MIKSAAQFVVSSLSVTPFCQIGPRAKITGVSIQFYGVDTGTLSFPRVGAFGGMSTSQNQISGNTCLHLTMTQTDIVLSAGPACLTALFQLPRVSPAQMTGRRQAPGWRESTSNIQRMSWQFFQLSMPVYLFLQLCYIAVLPIFYTITVEHGAAS
jgi:hypothetical protein